MLMRRPKVGDDVSHILPEFQGDPGELPLQDTVDHQNTRVIAELDVRLAGASETIASLQKRLTELEVFTHNLSQQRGVAQETMERQTRHSALDLAIKAAQPGASGAIIIPLYETFLALLRGTVH